MPGRNEMRRLAWAAVGKKSGYVLRGMSGHYAIYTHKVNAKNDCPTYGEVRCVAIIVQKKGKRK